MNTTELLTSVLSDLYARAPRGMRLGVEAMDEACERFGRPERGLSVVHVAGTNGKGSVSSMIESAARASGLRTGLYTSPHLARFAERIRIGGVPIEDEKLVSILGDVLAREPELSFFEVATLAAFVAFGEAKVDLAVIEVGLGGRLDATNVVRSPRVCAVTRIAFDHMDKLGDTLPAIAREKAAIAKPGVPLLIGPGVDDAIAAVIEEETWARGGLPVRADSMQDARTFRAQATLSLAGDHQRDNAMLAYAVCRQLGLDDAVAQRGIEAARWPGRLERIAFSDGVVLFDAAHNPDGADALARALSDLAHGASPASTALVFGALADKAWEPMLDRLAPAAATRVYTRPKGRASTDPSLLAARHPGATFDDVKAAYAAARRAVGAEGTVVVCGSIALVGELRAALVGEPADPPIAL